MVLEHRQNTRLLAYGFLGTFMMCLSYLIFMYDPLQIIIRMKLSLTNGSYTYSIWKKPPHEVLLKIFMFNVTNSEEFLSGKDKLLKVEEIGPYVYQEFLENTNAHFNENGTVSYVPQRTVKFVPEKSIGDPKEGRVIIPNIPLLGIASMVAEKSIFINLAINQLTTYLDSKPFLNITAYEYLWGYDDPLVRLATTILPSWIPFPRFGLLDRLFDEGHNVVTMVVDNNVSPSKNPFLTDQERVRPYSIQLWNGSPGLHHWGFKDSPEKGEEKTNSKCNNLEGAYEGTLFPRGLTPNDKFRVYRKAFCRTLPLEFDKQTLTEDGFDGFVYKMNPNWSVPDGSEINECYCRNKKCLPRGLSDLTPCYYGIPAAVSQPHFLNAEPNLLDGVIGLAPNKSEHDTWVILDPHLGVPIKAQSRMQINLVTTTTRYNPRTKPFDNMAIPLFWIEMSLDKIPPSLARIMTLTIHVLPKVQICVIVLLGFFGCAMLIVSVIGIFYTPQCLITPNRTSVKRNSYSAGIVQIDVDYTPVKIMPMRKYSFLIDRETNC